MTEATASRWRHKFAWSTVTDGRRLKELVKENARLFRLPASPHPEHRIRVEYG